MTATKTVILHLFKENLVSFLDELIEQFEETEFITMRILINEQIPIVLIMQKFIEYVIPFSQVIKNRDDSYFLNNDNIFSVLDPSQVNHFKTIWESDKIDQEDKDVIWDWFDVLLKCAHNYKNN